MKITFADVIIAICCDDDDVERKKVPDTMTRLSWISIPTSELVKVGKGWYY